MTANTAARTSAGRRNLSITPPPRPRRGSWLAISFRNWKWLIHRDVQQRYIDPRFAEEAEIRRFCKLRNQLLHLVDRAIARPGNSRCLEVAIRGTDMGL